MIPNYIQSLVKSSSLFGTVIGILYFGYIGDKYGRKKPLKISLMMIMIGEIGSSFSANLNSGLSIFAVFSMWRIFLGIGVGGIFQISVAVSEFAPVKTRGLQLCVVKAFQGFGILVASIISIIFLSLFRNLISKDVNNLDNVWRLAIIVGLIPCMIAYHLVDKIPETIRYTLDVEKNFEKAKNDLVFIKNKKDYKPYKPNEIFMGKKNFWKNFKKYFREWKNLKYLIIFSIARFTINAAVHGMIWNTSAIIQAIGFSGTPSDKSAFDYNFSNAEGNLICSFLGSIPGNWVSVGLIELIGRKKIQLFSYGSLFALMLSLGLAYSQITNINTLFIIIYTLLQFFTSFGGFTTVWIMPSECFPTCFSMKRNENL